MLPKIITVGHLTRDIELRYSPSGTPIGNTAIASSERYKAQDGTQKENTCFVDLTFWGRTAEIANQYLHKGSKVLIEGRLQQEQWTAQDGTKRSKHSVKVEQMQMLDSKPSNNTQSNQAQNYGAPVQNQAPQSNNTQTNSAPPLPEFDDGEIQF